MKPTLSLCVIAGNVEKQIGRFLDAFGPVADEVIVVSAVGNQEFDNTPRIVEWRGGKWKCYQNKIVWPHVDDFAAARNMACDMATGDWLMWADTDDIITPDSVEQIRRLIADLDDKDVDGVLMRYVVPEDGVVNWRERIWRKGKARWVHPIHECLQFVEGSKQMRFDGAEVVHASEKRSAARDERNLRILESIPEEDRTISQKFHIFQSLIALDRNDEAIMRAVEFAQLPDAGKNERYEAFFQLARLADESETKKQMLTQALVTDPTRREAYGELGLATIPDDPQAALGWTAAMDALRMPQDAPWNLRRAYYGKLGVSLRAMALRANGRPEEADVMETNHFTSHGAKISLLHATRGRPGKAWKTRMEWLRTANNPDAVEHIFAIDANDPQSLMLYVARCVMLPGNGGPVAAWNEAAKHAKGEVLVQLSDDFEPFQGWDDAILKEIADTSQPAVLAVHDGHRNDDLLCMAILTRARYKAQGYLFHPEFFSMFSDNWFSECAFRDGVVIDARDRITFEHVHPAFGKGEMDGTYARSNDSFHYQTGQGIIERLRKGIKVSADIEGWFDFRDVYDHVAKMLRDGATFVEVGSWKGQSACYLAQRIQDLDKPFFIHCVDTFKGDSGTGKVDVLCDFISNIDAANAFVKGDNAYGVIEILESTSQDASCEYTEGELDGVFIDAAHDYESCKADIEAWFPKVKEGGFFGGHDIDAPGVKRAVDEAGFPYQIIGRCWIKSNFKP